MTWPIAIQSHAQVVVKPSQVTVTLETRGFRPVDKLDRPCLCTHTTHVAGGHQGATVRFAAVDVHDRARERITSAVNSRTSRA
jgi:hypothetical protein